MAGADSILGGLLSEPNTMLFFALLIVFALLAYKVVKIMIRAAMIALAAGFLPIAANVFLGMPFEISLGNFIRFAMLGAEVYFTYHLLTSIGKIAEFITRPFGGHDGKEKKVEKVIIVEKEKYKDDKDDKNGKGKEA
jgi:hypothetical protein